MGYYTVLFVCFSLLSISDSTLLWRVNVDPPAYLLGTAHLPHSLIWSSLSDTAKSAFYNSTHFLPEFDITNFFSFTRFRMCLNSARAPGPSTGYMNQYNEASSILDIYLTLEARRLRKTIIALESVDMYCEFTKFQIESLLNNLTSTPTRPSSPNVDDFEQVKKAYNCDLNYPGELLPPTPIGMIDRSLQTFQQRLEEIVQRRDTKMTEMIDSLLKENLPDKRFFVAVGFIHLMGSDGIIAKLKRDYNYSVTRLCTDATDFRATLGCPGPSWCDHLSWF